MRREEPCFGRTWRARKAAVVGGAAGLEEVAVVDAGEMSRALGWKGKNAVWAWPRRAEEVAPGGAAIGGLQKGPRADWVPPLRVVSEHATGLVH